MPLKNVQIARETIKIADEPVSVRGVNLTDLMIIVNLYGPQAMMAFTKVQQEDNLTNSSIRSLIAAVATEFPEMMAAIIAMAADEYDEEGITVAKGLPINAQVQLLEVIFSLTFPNEGDIKKLIESLTKVMVEASGALTSMTQSTSSIGIGASDAA